MTSTVAASEEFGPHMQCMAACLTHSDLFEPQCLSVAVCFGKVRKAPSGSQGVTRFTEFAAGKPTPKVSVWRAACHGRLCTANCRWSQGAARKHEARLLDRAPERRANSWHATPVAQGGGGAPGRRHHSRSPPMVAGHRDRKSVV